jgi:hypothetical protein
LVSVFGVLVFFLVLFFLFNDKKDLYYQKGNAYYSILVSFDNDFYNVTDKNFYIYFKYNFFYSLKKSFFYFFFNTSLLKEFYERNLYSLEQYAGYSFGIDIEGKC